MEQWDWNLTVKDPWTVWAGGEINHSFLGGGADVKRGKYKCMAFYFFGGPSGRDFPEAHAAAEIVR